MRCDLIRSTRLQQHTVGPEMDDHVMAVVQVESEPSTAPVDAFHFGAFEQLLELLAPSVASDHLHGVAAGSHFNRFDAASDDLFFQIAFEDLDLRKLGHPVPFRPATPHPPRGVPKPPSPRSAPPLSCCALPLRRTVPTPHRRAP